MKNTLISHVLNRKVLRLGPTKRYPGLSFDNNILISELNDYNTAYNVKRYLFKVDHDRGKAIVHGLYELIPLKTKHIFMLYTNTVSGLNMIRMTQNIWAFQSDAEADQFMPEMLEQLSWAKGSHLVELPLNPNFDSMYWIDDFVDPYIYSDFRKILSKTAMRYHLIEHKNLRPIDFKPGMNLTDVTKYSNYNKQVYNIESTIIASGLSKYTDDECERLKKRKEHFQEQGLLE